MRIVSISINNSLRRIFLSKVSDAEFGISNYLNLKLADFKKNISDLTDNEIEELTSTVFNNPPILSLYNLEDEDGGFLLPMVYNDFFNESENKELFSVGKFGIQCIDLYHKSGKLIYQDAYWINFHSENYIEIWDQNSKIKIYRYRTAEGDLEFLGEPRDHFLERAISFSESRFFFNGGFVDQNFKSTTPNCFDNAKFFNEGLAPVCLNGKWGFINKQSEIVIDCMYGNVEPFNNGISRVFVLKSEYQSEKGIWIDTDRFFGYTQTEFLRLFPEFPQNIRKPLCFLRGNTKTLSELNEEYHYYADGVEDKYGSWFVINLKGEILEKNIQTEKVECSIIQDDIDANYWFDYVITNSDKQHIIKEIPDILFVDKIFVLRILERAPQLFHEFSLLYDDDDEVAELVFGLSFRNFDHFSERLRLKYLERYNLLIMEDDKQLFQHEKGSTQISSYDLPL
jgi:hypothetical protein